MSEQQLPEGWQMLRFGDIAEHISVRVSPKPGDEKRYIGLEHLDSGSLRINRWGSAVELKGQKLAIKEGDILFAKRNAYLKRVAKAPFDGIFSAHGMVIRPTGKLVDKDFLPFFMLTDTFMDRAISISEGSLSPTIKWKTLENQKFALPGLLQQQKMLTAIKKIYALELNTLDVINSLSTLRLAVIKHFFKHTVKHWTEAALGDIYEVQLGKMLSKNAKQGVNPKVYLTNKDVQWGEITTNELNWMDFSDREMEKFALQSGDILVCEGGEIGRCAIWREQLKECFYQKALHRLRIKEAYDITPEFMCLFLEYKFKISNDFKGQSMATTIAHIPREKLVKLSVSYPDRKVQEAIVLSVSSIDSMLKNLQRKQGELLKMIKSVINRE